MKTQGSHPVSNLKRKHHSKMLTSKFSLSRHLEYANEQITYHFWLCVSKAEEGNYESYNLQRVYLCTLSFVVVVIGKTTRTKTPLNAISDAQL
jgi:hypothetical protein